jgi:hypothetical protein
LRSLLTKQVPLNLPGGEPFGGGSRKESEQHTEPLRTRNTFTNMSVGDGSSQIVASATGLAIDARDVTTGNRASHGLGQMSDETMQLLLRCNEMSTTEQPLQRNGMSATKQQPR